MNMHGLLSSVHIAHVTCYWKFYLLHYVPVLCQYRLWKADHAYFTYLMLQQFSHKNGCKLNHRQAEASYIFCLASASPLLRICSFSWFCMTSDCFLHNSVIWSYTYGRLKTVCKFRTDVHLGKFYLVRRTLFRMRCISRGRCLPLIPKRGKHKSLLIGSELMEG
jgi:hypothetical protein